MDIVVTPDGPLDAPATLARYRVWGEDPANRVVGDAFLRVLRLGDRLVPYQVRWRGPVEAVRLTVRAPGRRDPGVEAALRREVAAIFGLGFDLPGFYRMARTDPVLGPLAGRLHGLRPTLAPTALEMLVGAITAQQVNLAFAFTLRARLVRRWGTPVALDGETVWAFPTAGRLAGARVSALRALQFSGNKAQAVRAVAGALAAGVVDEVRLAGQPNEAVVSRLTALRGLGRWSAEWFLARCLGRGDVCPAGDLAVRKVFARHWGRGRVLSEAGIRRRAAAWGAYQNLAVHYLLAGLRLDRDGAGGGT